ncbi:MAG: CinA family protein [Woeseiaceae bacterium]
MPEGVTLFELASALVGELRSAGRTVATAESCTGGWISKAITDVPGSSEVFAYGIVSYSNTAKEALLDVNAETLEASGAVSAAVVGEMARGVLKLSGADIAVAVSGVAGPDGGSDEKPVGTVWFAWSTSGAKGVTTDTEQKLFRGDRAVVRERTVVHALKGVRERIF